MIYTGLIVTVFVVFHVRMFKFADHPTVTYEGVAMKDLYAVVAEAFKDPWIVGAYVAVMILLGLHLRHGIWSAFQSLGLASDKWLPHLTRIALLFAILLAVGFLFLPVFMFVLVDPVAGR
jgi:succinate dehydrogenase / fumarate reductase cytochrome b subunit